jgi:hypothetical protein
LRAQKIAVPSPYNSKREREIPARRRRNRAPEDAHTRAQHAARRAAKANRLALIRSFFTVTGRSRRLRRPLRRKIFRAANFRSAHADKSVQMRAHRAAMARRKRRTVASCVQEVRGLPALLASVEFCTVDPRLEKFSARHSRCADTTAHKIAQ